LGGLNLMYKIPLYNCYWCRCAYCIHNSSCRRECDYCRRYGKFLIRQHCDKFIEDDKDNKILDEIRSLKEQVQSCDTCIYKKFHRKLKDMLETFYI